MVNARAYEFWSKLCQIYQCNIPTFRYVQRHTENSTQEDPLANSVLCHSQPVMSWHSRNTSQGHERADGPSQTRATATKIAFAGLGVS